MEKLILLLYFTARFVCVKQITKLFSVPSSKDLDFFGKTLRKYLLLQQSLFHEIIEGKVGKDLADQMVNPLVPAGIHYSSILYSKHWNERGKITYSHAFMKLSVAHDFLAPSFSFFHQIADYEVLQQMHFSCKVVFSQFP